MSSPIFFNTRSRLNEMGMLRPLEQCFFNKIELVCPNCTNPQWYNDTSICGDKSIVCDYCNFDIPLKEGRQHVRIRDGFFRDIVIIRSRI